jgi:nicotinic acid mononucleotide adenylyltransferase
MVDEPGVVLAKVQSARDLVAARVDSGNPLRNRVAVLPASFNPPTLAHLELLAGAREVDDVGSVACLLTTRNVDKGLFGAALEERMAMLLSLADPAIAVLVSNAARIADQAIAATSVFPGLQFDFVVGFDTLIRVFDGRYYENMHLILEPFFARHRLIAANRGQHDVNAVESYLATHPDANRYREAIVVAAVQEEAALMSSSLVRRHLATSGSSPHLPAEVARYIKENHLYRHGD